VGPDVNNLTLHRHSDGDWAANSMGTSRNISTSVPTASAKETRRKYPYRRDVYGFCNLLVYVRSGDQSNSHRDSLLVALRTAACTCSHKLGWAGPSLETKPPRSPFILISTPYIYIVVVIPAYEIEDDSRIRLLIYSLLLLPSRQVRRQSRGIQSHNTSSMDPASALY
jgi:hypothetical protein